MGEVLRELEAPVEGHFIVRVYASSAHGHWQAWLEFISLEHGDLSHSGIVRTASSREELSDWARDLGADEIHRALEDAELTPVSELGRAPTEGAASGV
ncbi:MAG: hypothetical protein ACRDGT_09760 [Candidatus Limnocylindria bacterium]